MLSSKFPEREPKDKEEIGLDALFLDCLSKKGVLELKA